MSVKREFLGETKDGAPIYGYHMTNDQGMEVCLMNYGAAIRNIFVKDKNGEKRDVVLGFESPENYFDNPCFIGVVVGPVANRIGGAAYSIDGKDFKMAVNDGPNNLHSDFDNGFHKRVWEAAETDNSVTFTLKSEDGDLGFSGNREFSVTYTLTEDNSLMLHYHATSDAKTLINITNHCYFNLRGHDAGTITDHVAQFNSSKTTVVGKGLIPNGEIADVEGTPFDFRKEKVIGLEIDADDEQLRLGGGYDHNFIIDNADGTRRTFATVTCPESGITMQCSTTLPAFQFYAGNCLDADGGKDGAVYKNREGFCLETQIYPDAIHHSNFPDAVFGPEREYDSMTVYRFL
ncbi:aldose epimerase family protein [Butyrivibrio sp. XPD2002]|uniref:aldose epimerase family protein n=1 Tax=Butyrivibrio sp. XPD2002 TaxID=1280665 RepID=UPI00041C769F|nr:aldose epimerase family protein [Butyrivibrio sp. XPD2002]